MVKLWFEASLDKNKWWRDLISKSKLGMVASAKWKVELEVLYSDADPEKKV
jgi:hypothetical protein